MRAPMISEKSGKGITLAFALSLALLFCAGLASSEDIDTCRELNTSGTVYNLITNVSNDSNCFTINNNSITLDCQGHTINYSKTQTGYAIENTGYNYTTIKNCVIVQENASLSSPAIYFDGGTKWKTQARIQNNEITTSGSYSYGIYLTKSIDFNITNNTISTSGKNAYGVHVSTYSDSSTVLKNQINTSGNGSHGIYLTTDSNYADISGNNVSTSGFEAAGINFMASQNSSIMDNIVKTAGFSGYGIQLYSASNSNLTGNKITTLNISAYGIFFYANSNNNIVANSTINSNQSYAMYFQNATSMPGNNFIYNCLLNGSSVPVGFSTGYNGANTWNTTKQLGNRIYSLGDMIGGNYYTNSSREGYSDNCIDVIPPYGFCDLNYTMNSANIDYLPLSGKYGIYSKTISNCTNLNQTGAMYYLTANITNSSQDYCISISADNLTLDCQGYIVDGDNTANYGIYVNESYNVTLRGCFVSDWNIAGVMVYQSSYNKILNVTAMNNGYGVDLRYSNYNVIHDSVLANNNQYDFGITTNVGTYCNNQLINVTGTDNKPIVYFNKTVTIKDWNNNVSEVVLCNADYSTIDNVTLYHSEGTRGVGLLLVATSHVNISNTHVKNLNSGINVDDACCCNNLINISVNSSNECLPFYRTYNNTLTNITATNCNTHGILFSDSENNTLRNSKLENNNYGVGIKYVSQLGSNMIYNNLFNNTFNVNFTGAIYNNTWNTTNQLVMNIVSGNNTGGNYWSNPGGTGYSDKCNGDVYGFCDKPYDVLYNRTCTPGVNCSNNTDYLPLSSKLGLAYFWINLTSPPNGTLTDDNITGVSFRVLGTATAYNCTVYFNNTERGNNASVINDTLTTITSIELSDGVWNWYVNCTTTVAVNRSETWILTVDTQPPQITLVYPVDGTNLSVGSTWTWINISTDENATCRYATAEFNYPIGKPFTNTGVMAHSFNLSGLSDGQSYTLHYKCNDSAGNINPSSTKHTFGVNESIMFYVDLNYPYNDTATNDSTPDFNFNVTGSESTYTCELFINNTSYNTTEYFTNVGNIYDNGTGLGVWGDGTYIYLANDNEGLSAYTFNGTDFNNVGHINSGGKGEGVWGDGTYIYLADGNAGLIAYTFNGTDFNKTVQIDDVVEGVSVWGDGTYIYLTNNSNGLLAYTFNGTDFKNVGWIYNGGKGLGVWGDGTYIYLANDSGGLLAYTFNGTDFKNTGQIDNGGTGQGVWGDGTYIYLANGGDGLRAYTFNGTDFNKTVQTYDAGYGEGVWGDGTYIYLANDDDGLRAYTFNGTDFKNVGHINNGSSWAMGVWGDGTYIYLANGNDGLWAYTFYALNNTPTTLTANPSLSDGTYNWYIDCTIKGVTNQSETREITINAKPPNITITNPENNTNLSAGTTWTWINISTDENAVCRWNTSEFTYPIGATFTITGGTTHSFIYSVLSDGENYTLYYKCNDGLGNINPTSTMHFFGVNQTPNNAPNKPTLNSPDNAVQVNKNFALLNWTCTDPDGDPMTTYIYGGNQTLQLINTTSNCLNGSSYTFNWTGLNETTYYWKVVCNDSDLENASDTYQFTVDWTAPTTISDCVTLNELGRTYLLNQDVFSNDTCFRIGADNVTLDCQDYTVTFSMLAVGSGVENLNGHSYMTVKNCHIRQGGMVEASSGIYIQNAIRGTIQDSIIELQADRSYGIKIDQSGLNNVYGDTIRVSGSESVGILFIKDSYQNTITSSKIISLLNHSIRFEEGTGPSPQNNLIYNNLINSSYTIGFDGTIEVNYWNTTKQFGTRIYGLGNEIGGNYYTNPSGSGYSDWCVDSNWNGFCDKQFNITNDTKNIDYYPLSDNKSYCGNYMIEGWEQCDGSNWGGVDTCFDLGFNSGTIACTNCVFTGCYNSVNDPGGGGGGGGGIVNPPQATCFDGIQNQGETGVDCGGPCQACMSCSDGIQNQGEAGVDCGGPCQPCVVTTTPTTTLPGGGGSGIGNYSSGGGTGITNPAVTMQTTTTTTTSTTTSTTKPADDGSRKTDPIEVIQKQLFGFVSGVYDTVSKDPLESSASILALMGLLYMYYRRSRSSSLDKEAENVKGKVEGGKKKKSKKKPFTHP